MRLRNCSGQSLLIAIMLVAILLISIPIIVNLNQLGLWHHVASQKRSKARAIAEAGIAYAAQQLSVNQATWDAAVTGGGSFNGSLPGTLPTDCNGTVNIPTPMGGGFRLTCNHNLSPTVNPGIQPYQVAVTALAYIQDRRGTPMPIRAIKAYLAQRTLGTDLPTGLHAAAALQMVNKPFIETPVTPYSPGPGPLQVHWGPIVSFDPTVWVLDNPLDQASNGGTTFQGFPRKFSQGGITGTVTRTASGGLDSDQKEYWAFVGQTFPPLLDETYYFNEGLREWGLPVPSGVVPGCAAGIGCGIFNVPGGSTATFTNAYTSSIANPNTVIFVNGNVQFDDLELEIPNGAFLVTGNVILGANGGGRQRTLRVPTTAPEEYFYWPAQGGQRWPGQNNVGSTISSNGGQSPFQGSNGGRVHFRGFLYVRGNLIVTQPNWNIVGSVQVGDMQAVGPTGTLIINSGANLILAYDDEINHRIHVNPVTGTNVKVVPETFRDAPLP